MDRLKFSIVVFTLLFSFLVNLSAQKTADDYLKAFTSRSLNAEQIDEFTAMADGEHYSMLCDEGKKIVMFKFQSGVAEKTILDIENVKGSKIKKITGYEFDANERKILISTERHFIY